MAQRLAEVIMQPLAVNDLVIRRNSAADSELCRTAKSQGDW